MKVLVTGADGFIGSHLTEELVRQGYEVRCFAMYNSFNSWGWLDSVQESLKESLEVFLGDIRDPHGVKAAMQGCDMVVHLAALIAIPYSYGSPNTYVDTNINGTLNVLQAARELGVKRLLHTSTSEVYGTAKYVPITEEHPLQGQSPYSATKIAADQLAYSYFSSFNLPVVTVRPFNTYGPRQSARAVIPSIITQLVAGNTRIRLGSTSPTRDFSYIRDTVDGFVSILGAKGGVGEVINLGSGYEISIKDLVDLISELMGVRIEVETDQTRLRPKGSEVERLLSDNSKAKNVFGWSPKYIGFEGLRTGLMETVEWFRKKENLRMYKPKIYTL
jgi:NAD dependent epimerase/dehydratase